MSGSIFIQIATTDKVADMVGNIVSGRRAECLEDLESILHACKGRLKDDVVSVQYNSSVVAVKASATVTVTADIAADDVVVIAGTTLTCKASGANGTTQFNKGADATATAVNLVNCVKANTTLNKFITASSALGVVTLTCLVPGTIGNTLSLTETSNVGSGITVSGANFANGAGGPSQVAVSF